MGARRGAHATHWHLSEELNLDVWPSRAGILFCLSKSPCGLGQVMFPSLEPD
jgi:hypothetical protein